MSQITLVDSKELGNRIDASYHIVTRKIKEQLEKGSKNVVSLGEICIGDIKRGRSPKKAGYLTNGIPVLKTVDITKTFIEWKNCKCVSEEFYELNMDSQPKNLDILITSTGVGSAGKVEIFDDPLRRCLCTAKISIVHPNPELVNPYFLYAFLKSKYGQVQMESSARGATGQVELYSSDIAGVLVPLMDQEFQEQIAEYVLDSRKKWKQYSKGIYDSHVKFEKALNLDSANKAPKKSWVLDYLDLEHRLDAPYYYYYESSLLPEENISSNWNWKKISDIAYVYRGITPRRVEYTEEGIKTIKIANITGVGLDRKFDHVSENFYNKSEKAHLRQGDIVVSSTGEGSIGKVDIYDDVAPALFVAEVSVIRLKPNMIDPYYIYLYLSTDFGSSQLERRSRGATGQQHLYPRDIKVIQIQFPNEAYQQELKPILETARNSLYLKTESENELITIIKTIENRIDSA